MTERQQKVSIVDRNVTKEEVMLDLQFNVPVGSAGFIIATVQIQQRNINTQVTFANGAKHRCATATDRGMGGTILVRKSTSTAETV